MKKFFVGRVIGFVVVLALVGIFFLVRDNLKAPDNGVACTMEAKICPDGSVVGRTGPNCEFSECPAVQIKEETTAGLNQKILNVEVYITPLEVVSDSRCPVDVTCIWAGEVKLKVKLEKAGITDTIEITLNKPVEFAGYEVTLKEVAPIKKAEEIIINTEYRFTFVVTPYIAAATKAGSISGSVTMSPTCPVERIPPDPKCAPRPYSVTIEIRPGGKTTVLKTIKSDAEGKFNAELAAGSYDLHPVIGAIFPRCNDVSIEVFAGQNSIADISCDTGIR